MQNIFQSNSQQGSSFLPEDYIVRMQERRSLIFWITISIVVIIALMAGFFVTHRRIEDVKVQKQEINARYADAAKEIELLKQLEDQKIKTKAKAELTQALIERSPRYILLSELINRMPEQMALTEVKLTAKEVKTKFLAPSTKPGAQKLSSAANSQKEEPTIQPPTYKTTIHITGIAIEHNDVAHYVSSLQKCDLLDRVDLQSSESTIVNERGVYKFKLLTQLRAGADARQIEPIKSARFQHAIGGQADAQQAEEK